MRAYCLKILSHLCQSFFANEATDDVLNLPKDGLSMGVLGVILRTVKNGL